MAAVVIFDIQQPPLGEREIAVNTHQFEPVDGIEARSLASQFTKGVVSVSFHDEARKTLWMNTWLAGEQKDVSFNAAGTEVAGTIKYQER